MSMIRGERLRMLKSGALGSAARRVMHPPCNNRPVQFNDEFCEHLRLAGVRWEWVFTTLAWPEHVEHSFETESELVASRYIREANDRLLSVVYQQEEDMCIPLRVRLK